MSEREKVRVSSLLFFSQTHLSTYLLRALGPEPVDPEGDQRVAGRAPGPGPGDAQGLEGPDVPVGLVGS